MKKVQKIVELDAVERLWEPFLHKNRKRDSICPGKRIQVDKRGRNDSGQTVDSGLTPMEKNPQDLYYYRKILKKQSESGRMTLSTGLTHYQKRKWSLRNIKSIAEALNTIPGVFLRQSGKGLMGTTSSVSMRGMSV
ncbi:MAG: hypothetical protein R2941_11085 [Desulfobacterales bacterium]